MMWYAVYKSDSGELASTGTVVADPLPAGMASIALAAEPDPQAEQWNAITRAFEPRLAESAPLAPIDFMRRFAMAEEVAIRTAAKTDVAIEVFLARLFVVPAVGLSHPETTGGISYLIAQGLLTAERGTEILNG
jgi:hypothetical protein